MPGKLPTDTLGGSAHPLTPGHFKIDPGRNLSCEPVRDSIPIPRKETEPTEA